MKFLPEGVNPALLKEFENIGEVETVVKAGEIFEGRVTVCDTARNLHIRLGKIHGVIPYKEGALGISDGSVRDIALISKVNKIVCFKVTGIGDFGGEAVALLSRRLVQQECMDNYISHLSVGDVIDAKVTHLEKFGAFIDIGAGINSLIPIDMLSVSRISHASQRLFEGELIRTVLKNKFDGKLTFTLKELLGTWSENAALFSVGETVTGVVRSVESYGVFVELMPNLAGLAEPCDDLVPGQCVSVYIKSIIPDKMKIKLVIVQAFDSAAVQSELVYFDERDHIDSWHFSPTGAIKTVEKYFE